MENQNQHQNTGEWEAWTHPHDFNPHIYVKGTVPTTGDKLIFKLKAAHPQGSNEKQMILDLTPDRIDSDGIQSTPVENFSTPTQFKKYDTVLIRTKTIAHVATVPVIEKDR